MSKKYKIIFCGIAFALVAIIVGLCLVFFGNKTIKSTPKSLEVQSVEGEYFLVSEYDAEYNYQFKLEQLIDEEFLTVGIVNSKINSIKIEDHNLNINAGGSYRFSVRFVNENGGGKGKFSKPLLWSPSWELGGVNYDHTTFEDDVLSWKVVPQAESYKVVVVDKNLQKDEFFCSETSFDTSWLKAGRYTVYVIAQNGDEFVGESVAGAGKQIVVERKNTLSNAHMSGWVLSLKSSYDVLKLEVYSDGKLLGRLDAGQRDGGIYTFENCQSLFSGIDIGQAEIKIKSLRNDCVLESDFVEISVTKIIPNFRKTDKKMSVFFCKICGCRSCSCEGFCMVHKKVHDA